MPVLTKSHQKSMKAVTSQISKILKDAGKETEASIQRSLAQEHEQGVIKLKEKSIYERSQSKRSAEAVKGVANLMKLSSDRQFELFYSLLAKIPNHEDNFFFIFERWNPNAKFGSIGYAYGIEFRPGLVNFHIHFPDSRDDKLITILDTDDFARCVALHLRSDEEPSELMENWRPYDKTFATLRQCRDIKFVQEQFAKSIKEKMKSIES